MAGGPSMHDDDCSSSAYGSLEKTGATSVFQQREKNAYQSIVTISNDNCEIHGHTQKQADEQHWFHHRQPQRHERKRSLLRIAFIVTCCAATLGVGIFSWHDQHESSKSTYDYNEDDDPTTSGTLTETAHDDSYARPWNQEQKLLHRRASYEYIVVGGGPAGILTATALAKHLWNTSTRTASSTPSDGSSQTMAPKVLLLESGTDSQASVLANLRYADGGRETTSSQEDEDCRSSSNRLNMYDIPLLWSEVASSESGGNGRRSSPSSSFSLLHHWPIKRTLLARALGGCGLFNAMIYVRSLPNDFDRWNLDLWTWDTMLSHYQRLEHYLVNNNADSNVKAKPWRGLNGPITTALAAAEPNLDSVAQPFVQSAINSGLPLAAEQGFNDPDPARRVGVGYYEFNIRNGVRDSVAQALLGSQYDKGNAIPPNLVIQTGATVSKVLIDTTNVTRAVGVEYMVDDDIDEVQATLSDEATSEVILAAGAIMTPQLLTNSGIGDDGDVVNLPGVGKNLQDHPVVALTFGWKPHELVAEQAGPSMLSLAAKFQDYFLSVERLRTAETSERDADISERTDSLNSQLGTLGTTGFSSGAFLKSPWAEHGSPDIQLTVFPRIVEPHVRRQENLQARDPYLSKSEEMLVTVALLQPQGRYEVRSAEESSELARSMEIKPNTNGGPFQEAFDVPLPSIGLPENETEYLTDMDVQRLSWGVNQVRRIFSFPPLYDMTQGERYPGANVTGNDLDAFVREHHLTNCHWVGSTKMGSADDPLAVVDDRLRVRGVDKLRIVDAGVIPRIPNGNTHSTVCAVASRAAELMVADRK